MRLALSRNNFLVPIVFTAGVIVGILGMPLWKVVVMAAYQTKYGEMTNLCDNAMRSHFIAKQKLSLAPSDDGVRALKAAEIGLLSCQDYDMMRKKLIRLGLDENDLASLSLQAIEAQADGLGKVINTHEITY